jgi:hypothetical protein
MSSGLINQEALREQYPSLSVGCFIKKPDGESNFKSECRIRLDYVNEDSLYNVLACDHLRQFFGERRLNLH